MAPSQYDFIVVGGGTAGCIIAARLSEDRGVSVLLLEAGPDYPDLTALPDELKFGYGTSAKARGGPHDWKFVARATDQVPELPVPRGKVTGGSSAINVQVFLRGLPVDFEAWAALGNDLWGFEHVLPYYRLLETDTDFRDEFHGADGPIICRRFKQDGWASEQLAFYNACRTAGFPDAEDMNRPGATGVGPVPMNNPDRIRLSTAIGYLNPARQRPNLTIRANCTAQRIRFDGKRATGVEVQAHAESFVVEGREIILTAGAIGTPHLLMLSGLGPSRELSQQGVSLIADLPGVGQNLRDHPAVGLQWPVREDIHMDPTDKGIKVALRYSASESQLQDDMFILASSIAREHAFRIGIGLYLPVGRGELRLASLDPGVQPLLDYNYLTDPFDRQRMREAVRLAIRLSQHRDFKPILAGGVEEPGPHDLRSDAALDQWILRSVLTFHHVCGTCKMGPLADPAAVTDQYGNVRGVEGMRIADASIMPDCVRANIAPTVMMIGERIAEFIKAGQ